VDVVITGASGNIGTALISDLLASGAIGHVTGLARRQVDSRSDGVTWLTADVTSTDLVPLLRGADAVVHLAWLFQPTRQPATTWDTNVRGTQRLLDAAAGAGVDIVVVSSSVGAYSPRTTRDPVDESWPTDGVPTAAYSREKAYVERLLDVFEHEHPGIRVVRIRPGFVFQRASATEQRRLFGGPLVPDRIAGLIDRISPPFIPDLGSPDEIVFQALHAADAAAGFRLALERDVRGAFNLAADPLIDLSAVAADLGVPVLRLPTAIVRAAVAAAWTARLVPTAPGLLDLLRQVPVMSTARARDELGWQPRFSSTEAVADLFAGLREGADRSTPSLSERSRGPLRGQEFRSGVGKRP
jgi:nucleoside-diphosphate-sugar epimerase